MSIYDTIEGARLFMNRQRETHWNLWGPYVSERAWGMVREDYSPDGEAWRYFPHDHARSRAYRWSEDGIAGICDWHQHLCFALALWNGRDPILKERRKDALGKNIFQGGFLGMDNIGAFDRGKLPPGYLLGQADGTSWMAAFAKNMQSTALLLAEKAQSMRMWPASFGSTTSISSIP